MYSRKIKIRVATENDCHDLWSWRNHPDVRRWCFTSSEIPYEEHKKWFARKIKDVNSIIYIAEDEKGEKLGQIRFDMDKTSAYININLNPRYFGKKLGHRMIKLATESFLKRAGKIREVVAEIIEDNLASIRAFQKADYLITGRRGKKENKNMLTLVYKNENKIG